MGQVHKLIVGKQNPKFWYRPMKLGGKPNGQIKETIKMVHNNNTMPNFSPDLNALYKGVQMMYHLFLNSSVKGVEISKASLLFSFLKFQSHTAV